MIEFIKSADIWQSYELKISLVLFWLTIYSAVCFVAVVLCLYRLEQDIQGAFGGVPVGGQLADGCEKRLVTEHSNVVLGLENLSIAKFLEDIGLSCLQDIFDQEQITMDILVEMGHDELKDIGISAYGHRHKILKRIERITMLYGMFVHLLLALCACWLSVFVAVLLHFDLFQLVLQNNKCSVVNKQIIHGWSHFIIVAIICNLVMFNRYIVTW